MRGLRKAFGSTVAVDGLDLDIPAGSMFGLVGPNGAGKTTTLSMVTGLLVPDAGTVRVHGVDLWAQPDRAKRLIGVLPDGLPVDQRAALPVTSLPTGWETTGRNAPCPCGSGKKFKHCHGALV